MISRNGEPQNLLLAHWHSATKQYTAIFSITVV